MKLLSSAKTTAKRVDSRAIPLTRLPQMLSMPPVIIGCSLWLMTLGSAECVSTHRGNSMFIFTTSLQCEMGSQQWLRNVKNAFLERKSTEEEKES